MYRTYFSSSSETRRCFRRKKIALEFIFKEDYYEECCYNCFKRKEFSYVDGKVLKGMCKSDIETLAPRKDLFVSKGIFERMLENLNTKEHSIDLTPYKLKDVVKEFIDGKVSSERFEDYKIMETVFNPDYVSMLSRVWVIGTVVKITQSFILLRNVTLQHLPLEDS
ncbi:hypothetical protein CR194_05190 [Salipaludibacillus keqinensis]|uniref:Uncharacterized protein n=1 Tax=Salipaludibacillus keqinensis TaxID=2045207 RepID=A0A323TJI2_9BACI|nr:hypothetical protein [Salipaludibacillus keqinensis]PYZ94919.1 hypothetical protein CR194_05190 [Salipaludibacillus keqinensis]